MFYSLVSIFNDKSKNFHYLLYWTVPVNVTITSKVIKHVYNICTWPTSHLEGLQSRREAEVLLTWWKLRLPRTLVKIGELSLSRGLSVPLSSCAIAQECFGTQEPWASELCTRSWVCLKHVLPCVQQKVMLAWVQAVTTRHWESKPVAASLEMELHFQARKGRGWAATSHLLSAGFQLAVTKQSNIFSPCPSSSAAYAHCSPELVLVEFCNELYQGAHLTKNEYSRESCWFGLQLHQFLCQTHCATMGELSQG